MHIMLLLCYYVDPPNVDVVPKQFTVNQTQPAIFNCTVFGIPIPELMWFKGDSSVPVQESESLVVTNRIFINSTGLNLVRSQLIFPEALRTDQSSYTCVAVNNITNLLTTPENGTTQFYVQGTKKCLFIFYVFFCNLYSSSWVCHKSSEKC